MRTINYNRYYIFVIKSGNKKTTEAMEGKKKADEARKLAIAEKELATKTKDELFTIIKKCSTKTGCY